MAKCTTWQRVTLGKTPTKSWERVSIIDHSGHQGHTHFRQPARHNHQIKYYPGPLVATEQSPWGLVRRQVWAIATAFPYKTKQTLIEHIKNTTSSSSNSSNNNNTNMLHIWYYTCIYIYTVRVDKSKQWGSWVFKPVFWQPLTIVLVA